MTHEEAKAKGWEEQFGVIWPPSMKDPASRHQAMFLGSNGEHKSPGFLGRKQHFREFMTLLFCHEKAVEPFEWHPVSEKILDAFFDETSKWTAIVGHGSSGKSRTIAAIMVADYLMDPQNTSCLVTSTTLTDGQRRVWGDVERFWYNAGLYFGGEENLPGIRTSATAMIRFRDPATGREDKSRGLALIPSGQDSDVEGATGRMVGFKAPRLRLFIDEGSHINWGVVECAESNLETGAQVDKSTGRIDFKVMVTLNPVVRSDTGGKLCCPVNDQGKPDWTAVDTTTAERWRNERGITIRISGYDSPNVKAAREGKCEPHEQPWTGLLNFETFENQRQRLPAASFQRQYMAIWPETEAVETVFTDSEIRHHGGHIKVMQRAQLVAKLRALDPAWTHDGDGAPLVFCDLVRDETGRMILEFSHWEAMDKGLDPTKDMSIQLEDKVAARLNALNVQGKDFGIDITGGGRNVDDHVRVKWPGAGRLGVVFNGAPSDRPVSSLDPTPANEKYTDLMTEMWMFLKELLMSGQLKNLPEPVIEELCARRYGEKADKKGRITLEETRKMKKRLGRSPDVANALAIAAHVAKMHYGLTPMAKAAKAVPPDRRKGEIDFSPLMKKPGGSFRALAQRFNNLANTPSDV